MTIPRLSSKTIVSTAIVALLLGLAPFNAHAQSTSPGSSTSFIDSTTQMRSIRKQPTSFDSTTGAPQASNGASASYQGNPGCNSSILNDSLQNSANFSYTQTVATHVNTMQEPTSLSSCIQGLITKIRTFANVFSAGFSLDAAISIGYDAILDNLVTSLENEACSAVGSITNAASGPLGTVKKNLNFNNIGGTGLAINVDMGASAGVTP